MSEELKPCPFCGGEAKLEQTDGEDEDGEVWHHAGVICENAGCHIIVFTDVYSSNNRSDFDAKKLAVDAWNTRAEVKCKRCLTGVLDV